MWYAMQVKGGSEKKTMQLCQAGIAPALLKECFYPQYELIRKEKGVRRVVNRILFPGYLFLDTTEIRKITQQLWRIPELTKVIKVGQEIIPIQPDEEEFLRIHGGKNHLFAMSKGYMIGDFVKIEEGAFAGYYGKLKYVNRHNRFGIMEVQMFGKTVEMQFGLEIIRKIGVETEAEGQAAADAETEQEE